MNLFVYRLLFLICISICFLPRMVFAQTTLEGQVLDKTTEAPIPFATVTLSKARIATRTNDQGYFNLYAASIIEKDNLIFTCVGYQTYRMPVSVYKRGMFVIMQPRSTQLKEVVIGVRKRTKKLGAFSRDDLDPQYLNLGWSYPEALHAAQMYAKLFTAPKDNPAVTAVDMGRWEPDADGWETQPGKISNFKIHVMTVNPTTGAPDSILYTKEMTMHDRSRKVSVKLDSGVIVGSNKFFIAIEWLRVPYNEYILKRGYFKAFDDVENRGFDRVVYQPILAQYGTPAKVTNWQMTNGVWVTFLQTRFQIALSATVNY